MPQFSANGLRIEVETLGDPGDPAVLLIMGLGMQLVAWPEEFCRALVDAGYFVIRFDNRDTGLSEKLDGAPPGSIPLAALRYFLRLPVRAPYTLEDMAADAVAVLDALGVEAAHVVGVSLGGMIAQTLASEHPHRCLSLTSIMSTSGDRRLPTSSLKVTRMLLFRPAADAGLDELLDHYVEFFRTVGSPGFPTPERIVRERLNIGLRRSYHPAGVARQLLAIAAAEDRSAALRRISRPTLVVHGDADPFVRVAHGIDCARKIPGASLKIIPGMGHDLAPGLVPILCQSLIGHLQTTGSCRSK
jgi:pimeloyl-ACP methyl ester carboxylesterase